MGKIYIGIDNGVTGSIAVVGAGIAATLIPTPTKVEIDYQQSKTKTRTRVDHFVLLEYFKRLVATGHELFAVCERPMINPHRFDATISASRAQESLLIALETHQIPFQWIDSKNWQHEILPKGCAGTNLKLASRQLGKRFFPKLSDAIDKQTDADALLMALWALRNNL